MTCMHSTETVFVGSRVLLIPGTGNGERGTGNGSLGTSVQR